MIGKIQIHPVAEKRLSRAGLAALLLLANLTVTAYEPEADDYLKAVDPALGISVQFGRWDTQINLVYDPDGAPDLYADPDIVLALLEEAAGEWELVSGISINVTGTDSNIPNDDNQGPDSLDGLVRVFWGSAGGAAGRAGPGADFYDQDRGYFPYVDGSVELNQDPGLWEVESELVGVLVHELGHLMGLGHSDNPDSAMYANPYNHLNHPRADDILAARALYGNGSLSIQDVTEPLDQWLYSPPPLAPASATANLFKANAIFDQGSFIAINSDQPLSEVNAGTPEDEFLWFYFASGPSSTNIDIDATIVQVDPFGYVYDIRVYEIDCEANFSCASGTTVGETNAIKTIPGEWTIYVIDDATNTTLHSRKFEVNTANSYNKPPEAEITVTGMSGNTVNISLEVTDPENDSIEVVWNAHGNLGDQDNDGFLDTEIIDSASSGDTVSRNISFPGAEPNTLFIELRDDATRYSGGTAGTSSAGDGFRNLIAIDVDLPVSSDNDVIVRQSYLTDGNAPSVDTGGGSGGPLTGQVLVNFIAETSALELVSTSDKSATTARFGAGATKDGGLSTASNFTAGDEIVIAGSVSPQLNDIGLAGEVFVVLFTTTSLSYLDVDGNFVTWSGSLKTIQPAFERTDLLLTENFELFSGVVQSGRYRVFLGYRVTEGAGGPIHFNAKAFNVIVD